MRRRIFTLSIWATIFGAGCFDGDGAPTPLDIVMTEIPTGETLAPTQPLLTEPPTEVAAATDGPGEATPTNEPTHTTSFETDTDPGVSPTTTDGSASPDGTQQESPDETESPLLTDGISPTAADVESTPPPELTDPLATPPLDITATQDVTAIPTPDGTPDSTPVPPTPTLPSPIDVDQDGFDAQHDCNDQNGAINPSAQEICDGQDNNCTGGVDEGLTVSMWKDGDGDGYGAGNPSNVCPGSPGYVNESGDCADTDPQIHPGAAEICDNIDNNCSGQADEGTKASLYLDKDGDGYGSGSPVLVCGGPEGYSEVGGDCNDNDAAIKPGASEVCNGKDDDCDATSDEGVTQNLYKDNDGDGYGAGSAAPVCTGTSGYAAQAGDCNDADPTIRPGATEVCNNKDDDCDGQTDEGLMQSLYLDGDGDGYGTGSATLVCAGTPGYSAQAGDCNDQDAAIKPGSTELCNNRDDDCDGQTDEEVTISYYVDTDGDGYGLTSEVKQACSLPSGYSATAGDCDDLNPAVNPDANEILGNGIDENCDGFDGGASDFNDDGYADLVVANARSNSSYKVKSSIYFGSPSGTSSTNKLDFDTTDARGSCSADFDLDGYLDVVFANQSSDGSNRSTTSTLFYGSPTGPVPTSLANFPTEGAIDCVGGDFDADGDVDLVFIQSQTAAGKYNHNAWLYSNDDGVLSTSNPSYLPTYGAVAGVAGDVDADGYVDLLISNARSDSSYKVDSYIYWGSTSGLTSGNRTTLPTQGAAGAALIYDVNQDGSLDVVFGNGYDGTSYSINSPVYFGPNFALGSAQNLPTQGAIKPAAGDLNGDGFVDLVFPGRTDGDCSAISYVYYGNSGGTWSTSSRTALNLGCMTDASVGDTERDGYDDLIISSYASNSSYTNPARYYPGGSDGIKGDRVAYLNNTGTLDLDVGDLDGDGWADIAFGSWQDNTSDYQSTGYVFWGSSRGIPNSRRTDLPAAGVMFPLVDDLNHDGWKDVLLAQRFVGDYQEATSSRIYWGSARGPRGWTSSTIGSSSAAWACSGDFNQDGLRDVVIANYEAGGNTDTPSFLYYGTPTGPSSSKTNLSTKGATFCLVEDLDGDGDEDIVFANYESNGLVTTDSYVYWNSAGTFSTSSSSRARLPTVGAAAVAAWDVTGDGRKDLLFSNNWDTHSYLYKSTPTGFDPTPVELGVDSAFRPAIFRDFDQDGYVDILLQGFYNDTTSVPSYIYYGDATLSYSRKTIFTLGMTSDAEVGDINRDGWLDIVFATYWDGDYNTNAWVYWGSSSGFSTTNRQALATSGTSSLEMADLNRDNLLDLVFLTYFDGDSSTESFVFYNKGTVFTTPGNQLPSFNGSELKVTDLDGDTWPELIMPHIEDNQDTDVPTYLFWGGSRGYFRTNYTSFSTNGNIEVDITP